jgi:hypothetical protein
MPERLETGLSKVVAGYIIDLGLIGLGRAGVVPVKVLLAGLPTRLS